METKTFLVTDEDRDDLYEVIPYCSQCVEEAGDSSFGYCKEHMDPIVNRMLARHYEAAEIRVDEGKARVLDELANAFIEADIGLIKSADTLRHGARNIRAKAGKK